MIFVSEIKWDGCLKCKYYSPIEGCTKDIQDDELVIEWLAVYCMLGEEGDSK
jgi:hypothetical protein